MNKIYIALLFFCLACNQVTSRHSISKGGLSAGDALVTMNLPDGFKIELIASEPLISDPVDMEIDEEGKMYVVEMHGYPLDLNNTGKVIMLTDKDGDGRMDSRTVFAEGFIMPSGVMRWKKGLLVTDARNVLYLEDTDGDGKADIKDTVLTGFALTNPQYLVNNPVYGLDNWIYLAHGGISQTETYKNEFGDIGKQIFYPRHPDSPRLGTNAMGKMVRFRPDKLELETTSAHTQFGHSFDMWGHHLLVENDNHIYQEVIEEKYLERNPQLIVGVSTQSLSDHGNAGEVYSITTNPLHQLLTDVGVFTSACGITAYTGGTFPAEYNHDITFVCEPVSNIVHADVLHQKGASIIASRKLENKEFLASTDAWFRPVNLYIGPDGALYVVDYYREIIEHPEWMSDEAIKSGKLSNGIDKGRIYRISRSDAPKAEWSKGMNLNKFSDEQLVKKLGDSNIWWRSNAQRLLLDRNSGAITGSLIEMLKHSPRAAGRLHALWTLEGLGKLNAGLIKTALKDSIAGIRENAIKIAELHLNKDINLGEALLNLKDDMDPGVRFQLLCTLGSLNTTAVRKVQEQLLFKNIADPWMQIAALSASYVHGKKLLQKAIANYSVDVRSYGNLIERLAYAMGANEQGEVLISLIRKATTGKHNWQSVLMDGLADGMRDRDVIPEEMKNAIPMLVHVSLNHSEVSIRRDARLLLSRVGFPTGAMATYLFNNAKNIVGDSSISSAFRAEALHLLTPGNAEENVALFQKLILSDESSVVQLAALRELSAIPDTIVSSVILSNWKQFNSQLKDAALNTFLITPFSIPRIKMLLRGIQNGVIDKNDLGWSRTVVLMRDIPDELKAQARALLADENDNRKLAINEYKEVLKLKGDNKRGETIYLTHCVICHKARGNSAVEVGPDLGTVHGWTTESILVNILDPNKSIAHGYETWAITQKDGTFFQGIIISETQNAIILRDKYGLEVTISKRNGNISSKRQLGISLMPVGFEKKIDKKQMADLIAFIKKGDD